MVHPQLSTKKHNFCAEQIKALDDCHKQKPIGKFFGYCNYAAMILDDCLKERVSEKNEFCVFRQIHFNK